MRPFPQQFFKTGGKGKQYVLFGKTMLKTICQNSKLRRESLPKWLFGQRRFQTHLFRAVWAPEAEPPGVQVYAAVAVASTGTVLHVAFDRATDRGELCPYLVVLASQQLHMEQVVPFAAPERPIGQFGPHSAFFVCFKCFCTVLGRVFLQKMRQVPFCFGRWVLHYGQIFFLNKPVLEQQGHGGHRFGIFGQKQKAAHGAVEPVDEVEFLRKRMLRPL
jgi:hypothetical protein